jgi:hypothetical protein
MPNGLRLSPADACIYCGATPEERELELEHIIPNFLGGHIKFPEASCRQCAELINKNIENPIAQQSISMQRRRLITKKSRTSSGKKNYKILITDLWGRTTEENIDYSSTLLVTPAPMFGRPPMSIDIENPIQTSSDIAHPFSIRLNMDKNAMPGFERALVKKFPWGAKWEISDLSFNTISYYRLFKKIGAGLLFDACPQSTIASGIGGEVIQIKLVLPQDKHGVALYPNVYSLPDIKPVDHGYDAIGCVFEYCSNGSRHLYAAFKFNPRLFHHVYFVRIPSIRTGELLRVDYTDRRIQQE